MSKTSTRKAEVEIPVLRREQLGTGVRGKYYAQYTKGSNVVVLRPEISRAFPTSEAVNEALAHVLTLRKFASRAASRGSVKGKR
jgi:hypothetical protein